MYAGDTIIFDSVSRMSRDAEEGFTMYEDLLHINTETYKSALQGGIPTTGTDIDCILEGINKYLLLLAKEQIRLAFEQSEKEIILKHNKTFGRLLNNLENITQVGITRKTFYKYKKELLSEMIEQTDQRWMFYCNPL